MNFSSTVETLHGAGTDRGVKHRFDLVASKVNFDRLKDRRKKDFWYFLAIKSTEKVSQLQSISTKWTNRKIF